MKSDEKITKFVSEGSAPLIEVCIRLYFAVYVENDAIDCFLGDVNEV